MSVETSSMFERVIQDHLALKERNARLDGKMPIERYKDEDPFDNHPLFKTEEQARIEETMDGVDPDFSDETLDDIGVGVWPGQEQAATAEVWGAPAETRWPRSRARTTCSRRGRDRLLEHRRRPRLQLGRLISSRVASDSLAVEGTTARKSAVFRAFVLRTLLAVEREHALGQASVATGLMRRASGPRRTPPSPPRGSLRRGGSRSGGSSP